MSIRQAFQVVAIAWLAVVAASAVSAQEVVATSFDQMRLIARLGDTLTVTDNSGSHITGRFSNLSSSSL